MVERRAQTERILAFDILRGYFLCVILLNHLEYYPNGLTLLTGQGFLYASTAEGFFAVSGIVLGIVRGRKLLNQPLGVATKLLWKRALQLYATSIALTLLFTLLGQFFLTNPGLKTGIYTDWGNTWDLLWQTITLRYTYSWADFLRFYALFLAAAPAALWLIRQGRWYLVTAASLGLWALYPLVTASAHNTELFQPLSWQFIFFQSFIVGFYWQSILSRWRALSPHTRHTVKVVWVALFILTLTASFVLVFGAQLKSPTGHAIEHMHNIIEQHFNKDRMPLERVALGTLWFWGLFIIVRRYEHWLYTKMGWLLYEFGSNSLYVYTISAMVVFVFHLIVPAPGLDNRLANLVLSLAGLALVWLALRQKFLKRIIPR